MTSGNLLIYSHGMHGDNFNMILKISIFCTKTINCNSMLYWPDGTNTQFLRQKHFCLLGNKNLSEYIVWQINKSQFLNSAKRRIYTTICQNGLIKKKHTHNKQTGQGPLNNNCVISYVCNIIMYPVEAKSPPPLYSFYDWISKKKRQMQILKLFNFLRWHLKRFIQINV